MMSVGGYHEYSGGCSVHSGDTMSTLGDTIMSLGGYHEYTRGCSVHWGFHTNSIVFPMTFSTFIMISPKCTHDIPLVY